MNLKIYRQTKDIDVRKVLKDGKDPYEYTKSGELIMNPEYYKCICAVFDMPGRKSKHCLNAFVSDKKYKDTFLQYLDGIAKGRLIGPDVFIANNVVYVLNYMRASDNGLGFDFVCLDPSLSNCDENCTECDNRNCPDRCMIPCDECEFADLCARVPHFDEDCKDCEHFNECNANEECSDCDGCKHCDEDVDCPVCDDCDNCGGCDDDCDCADCCFGVDGECHCDGYCPECDRFDEWESNDDIEEMEGHLACDLLDLVENIDWDWLDDEIQHLENLQKSVSRDNRRSIKGTLILLRALRDIGEKYELRNI